MKQNIILGIDPGLHITGYGVLQANCNNIKLIEAGVIKTSINSPLQERLDKIYQTLLALIDDTQPKTLILEELYSHYKHPATSIKMGHARGMALLAAQNKNIKVIGYSAKRIKKAVTGNGNATKAQVRETIKHRLNIKANTGPLDVTDALALCLGHIHINQGKI